MKKIIALSLAVLTLIACLVSCGTKKAYDASPKEFDHTDAFTITLTESFVDQQWSGGYSSQFVAADGTTCTIDTIGSSEGDSAASLTNEKRDMLMEHDMEYSMYDQFSEIQQTNGLSYFTYRTISADKTHFLCHVENDGEFYRIEFWCEASEYETFKPYFIQWVDSIVFAD